MTRVTRALAGQPGGRVRATSWAGELCVHCMRREFPGRLGGGGGGWFVWRQLMGWGMGGGGALVIFTKCSIKVQEKMSPKGTVMFLLKGTRLHSTFWVLNYIHSRKISKRKRRFFSWFFNFMIRSEILNLFRKL